MLIFDTTVQEKEANSMELNVREENLRNLFKQFQVEHNENCKTVFIDNNDEIGRAHV